MHLQGIRKVQTLTRNVSILTYSPIGGSPYQELLRTLCLADYHFRQPQRATSDTLERGIPPHEQVSSPSPLVYLPGDK